MFPNWDAAKLFTVTATCLGVYSLYITLAFYRKVGFSRSLHWFNLIICSFWALLDNGQLILIKGITEQAPFYLASKFSFVGSGAGLIFLLRCFCAYLSEDLMVESKIKSSDMVGIRWRKTWVDILTSFGQIVMVFGGGFFPYSNDPSSSLGLRMIAMYVIWVLARVAILGFTIAFSHATFSTGLITPNPSVINHAMVFAVFGGMCQFLLELCTIFGPWWLVLPAAATMQLSIAAMLFVGHLELKHQANTKPLSHEISSGSDLKSV